MNRVPAHTLTRRVWLILSDAVGHLNEDDGWAMASHVSLSVLMAIFPFFIFVAALAGFVGEQNLATGVAHLLFETWPEDVAGPIARDVDRVLTQPHGGLLTFSIVIMIYLATNGVEAVRTALNRAYRVSETRSFFFLRAQSIAFVLIGAVASLSFAFLGVLGPTIFEWAAAYAPKLRDFEGVFDIARITVTAILVVTVLVSAHLFLPASRPPALRLWPGIVTTLALWLVTAWAFGFYLQRFANYAAYYAGLASVFTAIVFLYLISLMMIFGAEFNAALARYRERR